MIKSLRKEQIDTWSMQDRYNDKGYTNTAHRTTVPAESDRSNRNSLGNPLMEAIERGTVIAMQKENETLKEENRRLKDNNVLLSCRIDRLEDLYVKTLAGTVSRGEHETVVAELKADSDRQKAKINTLKAAALRMRRNLYEIQEASGVSSVGNEPAPRSRVSVGWDPEDVGDVLG